MKILQLLTWMLLLTFSNDIKLFGVPQGNEHNKHDYQKIQLVNNNNPNNNQEIQNDCSICLESLDNPEEITTLLCPSTTFETRHRFHAPCIEQWFEMQKPATCPLCKTKNPLVLSDEVVAQRIQKCLDEFKQSSSYKKYFKFVPLAAITLYLLVNYFTTQDLSIPFDRLEQCKQGVLSVCTLEELCSIHDIWEACPCSLDDLRGCLSTISQKVFY